MLLATKLIAPAPSGHLIGRPRHRIAEETVHGLVEMLLEFQPPNLHVVLSTREDPPLPIARLRARQRLQEIRTHDLRFTPDEASELLASVLGRTLENQILDGYAGRAPVGSFPADAGGVFDLISNVWESSSPSGRCG